MSPQEAARIEQAWAEGLLDPDLPGTMQLVDEAHRVRVRERLWGSEYAADHPPQRLLARLSVAGGVIIVATIAGLCLDFLMAH